MEGKIANDMGNFYWKTKDEEHVAGKRERERDGEIDGGDLEKWVGCTLY